MTTRRKRCRGSGKQKLLILKSTPDCHTLLQAEIEMRQAQEAAQRQREAESIRVAKGSDDEDDNGAVQRQRAMDDYKANDASLIFTI